MLLCQHLERCIMNSMENMDTDVGGGEGLRRKRSSKREKTTTLLKFHIL